MRPVQAQQEDAGAPVEAHRSETPRCARVGAATPQVGRHGA